MLDLRSAPGRAARGDGRARPSRNPMDVSRLLNPENARDMHGMHLPGWPSRHRLPCALPMEVDGELPAPPPASPRVHHLYLPPIRAAPTAPAGHGRRAPLTRGARARDPLPLPPPSAGLADGRVRKPKKKPTGSFSNRPYTQEQVHWLRYHNEDCDLSYSEMFRLWGRQFPHPSDARGDGQNFSSRLYRDHKVPAMDARGDPTFDAAGKPRYIECKVRQRTDPAQMDIPFKLVEKHPEWALYWSWVSPADKAIARQILDGKDLDFAQTKKEVYRQAIRKLDAVLPPRKGWYSSPSHHAEAMRKRSLCPAPELSSSPPAAFRAASPDWRARARL
ncbi:unnamed protein product [Diplocarpon coronariae]